MRKVWLTLFLLIGVAVGIAGADTFNLTTGETISGELLLSSANDAGVQFKLGDGEYKRVSWSGLSQADLKRLEQNPKLQAFVEPFIEITQEERVQKTEVRSAPPPRLDLPPKKSLIGSMFSSSLGIFILIALYAANLYAGYEVALYRGQSVAMVCGISAVLPIIGPTIFLLMKPKVAPTLESQQEEKASEAQTDAAPGVTGSGPASSAPNAGQNAVNPMQVEGAEHPTSLHIVHEEPKKKVPHPPTATYQRGQFTFNRRFFETKFTGFFGLHRKEEDKGMVLVFKTARGEYVGERISRIASNDLHLQVRKGDATEEVLIPFTEVHEIRHKHKDA